MADQFGKYTVQKLKRELSLRGASTNGRKEALVERLYNYDRFHNFERAPILIPDPIPIVNWPTSNFKTLTSNHRSLFPAITKSFITTYLISRMAIDNTQTRDFKALEKGKLLLEALKVKACSVNLENSQYIDFSGVIDAAMKKRVSYNFKLRLSRDDGDIINTSCECPAGMGPHATCKHIATILLMLNAFVERGEILINTSCTETLQSFHKPSKSHSGSPIKAEDLGNRKRTQVLQDPRPEKFRRMTGYEDRLRNLTINYCANSNHDVTMRYLYPKANIQQASADHDYMERSLLENLVDKANKVDSSQAAEIERRTMKQALSKEWHDLRSWRITASKFGEVEHSTHRRNYDRLCEAIVKPKPFKSEATSHGIKYEPVARKAFEDKTGKIVKECGLFICVENPYLACSPDGLIGDDQLLEVKCPFNGKDEAISEENQKFLFRDSSGQLKLKTNTHYYAQVQGQLYITGRKMCYFVVYTKNDIFVEEISLNKEYMNVSLLPKLDLFYTKHMRPYIAKHCF